LRGTKNTIGLMAFVTSLYALAISYSKVLITRCRTKYILQCGSLKGRSLELQYAFLTGARERWHRPRLIKLTLQVTCFYS
jgi:hypothetical protein